jgi:hypothetical protein
VHFRAIQSLRALERLIWRDLPFTRHQTLDCRVFFQALLRDQPRDDSFYVASPIPLLAPVMTTTLSLISPMEVASRFLRFEDSVAYRRMRAVCRAWPIANCFESFPTYLNSGFFNDIFAEPDAIVI